MAEKSVGRRATRRRSIEPGRIQAPGETVHGSSADGVVANNKFIGFIRDAHPRSLPLVRAHLQK
jgi:hypothetical protein